MDLGTANTLVFAKGAASSSPSLPSSHQKNTNAVEAVGRDAKEMLGRTPGNMSHPPDEDASSPTLK